MAILLSTKPEWVAKICHEVGRTKDNIPIYEKRIEVRKGKPDKLPCKVYIYCNKSDKNIVNKDWSGKVIGEFICNRIDVFTPSEYGIMFKRFSALHETCLTVAEMRKYANEKPVYGWHIANLKIYDNPKELHEFYKPCADKYEYCEYCEFGIKIIPPDEEEYALYHGGQYEYFNMICTNYVKRAPQSYMYVRELCE